MLPQDIEVWKAVDLPAPEQMRYIPDNCVICSCEGLGITALAGGDYDGDVVMVSTDADTPDGRAVPKLQAAASFAKENLPKTAPQPCNSLVDYINHCCRAPTPQLRGVTCAWAERAQLSAWKARFPLKKRTPAHPPPPDTCFAESVVMSTVAVERVSVSKPTLKMMLAQDAVRLPVGQRCPRRVRCAEEARREGFGPVLVMNCIDMVGESR